MRIVDRMNPHKMVSIYSGSSPVLPPPFGHHKIPREKAGVRPESTWCSKALMRRKSINGRRGIRLDRHPLFRSQHLYPGRAFT